MHKNPSKIEFYHRKTTLFVPETSLNPHKFRTHPPRRVSINTLFLTTNTTSIDTMSAPTDTTTELMTEHLQYAPLTLIDDVINSANAILYQSMDAFETYLRDTLIPSIPSSTTTSKKAFDLDASDDPEKEGLFTELEFGMAQVETLLENAVDRNFDAFELYVLRNVFNVPEEVEGYLRLQHHQVCCHERY